MRRTLGGGPSNRRALGDVLQNAREMAPNPLKQRAP